MSMPSYAELVEILRERELELFAIRRNFDVLSDKFSQLENAFAINLDVHRTLESELEIHKLGKNPSKIKKNYFDENMDKDSKTRTELYSSLTRVRMEKERWKEAFLHKKKVAEKQKLEHEKSIDRMRDECEKILKNCRENGEKHFRELLTICEGSHEKVRVLEEALKASQARERSTRHCVLELASILETLKKVEDVRIDVLCEHATEVLRGLANGGEKPYEEGMRKLRQVIGGMKGNDRNQSLGFLQAQNSVLRHVVKSLKRKLQDKVGESPGNEEFTRKIETNNNPDGSFVIQKTEEEEKCEKTLNNEAENSITKLPSPFRGTDGKFTLTDVENLSKEKESDELVQNEKIHENINPRSKRSIHVEAYESHRNGIRYEEYTFHFFNEQELRVRHSNALRTNKSTLIVEFVNSEKKFHEAPLDRTVFYVGENVKEIVNFEKSVIHCGVQTRRIKFIEKFVQTTITGSNGFFRVNAGIGMLNSEKRAIERSLGNLESTVASLKKNALGQARSMIGCDVEYLGNEFFDCLRRLEC